MKIGILFGGRSYEHDISVITAAEAYAALKGRAELYPIYATEGRFLLIEGGIEVGRFAEKRYRGKHVTFEKGVIRAGRRRIFIDCMLMCCHGGEGENGSFSALMEVYNIPYTASSVCPSAVTMDKRRTKIIAEKGGFPTPRAIWGRWGEDLPKMASELRYPLIVKPARLGSSIGIGIAHNEEELIGALSVAFSFDRDAVIEEVVEDAVELNCAAFFEGGKVIVGGVENPRSWQEFLTFDEKYRGGKYKSGGNAIVRGDLAERVRTMTERIYREFELFGIVRIDYLYSEKEDVLYLNEINSQPGSLAFYLFEEIGIEFSDLLFRVIEESILRFKQNDIIQFNSGVLDNLSVLSRK